MSESESRYASAHTVINRTKVWGDGCFHYKLKILKNKDFISRIKNLCAYGYQCYTAKGIQKSVQDINPQLRVITTARKFSGFLKNTLKIDYFLNYFHYIVIVV